MEGFRNVIIVVLIVLNVTSVSGQDDYVFNDYLREEFDFLSPEYREKFLYQLIPTDSGKEVLGTTVRINKVKAGYEKYYKAAYIEEISSELIDTSKFSRFNQLEILSIKVTGKSDQIYEQNLHRIAKVLPSLPKLRVVYVESGHQGIFNSLSSCSELRQLFVFNPSQKFNIETDIKSKLSFLDYTGSESMIDLSGLYGLDSLKITASSIGNYCKLIKPLAGLAKVEFSGRTDGLIVSDLNNSQLEELTINSVARLDWGELSNNSIRKLEISGCLYGFDRANLPKLIELSLITQDTIEVERNFEKFVQLSSLNVHCKYLKLKGALKEKKWLSNNELQKLTISGNIDFSLNKLTLPKSLRVFDVTLLNSEKLTSLRKLKRCEEISSLVLKGNPNLTTRTIDLRGGCWLSRIQHPVKLELNGSYDIKKIDKILKEGLINALIIDYKHAENHLNAICNSKNLESLELYPRRHLSSDQTFEIYFSDAQFIEQLNDSRRESLEIILH